jgi:hypothetical protein
MRTPAQRTRAALSFICQLVAWSLVAHPAVALQNSQASETIKAQSVIYSKAIASQIAIPQSRITFQDLIERSHIGFQLKNSISAQRYSIETMLGGVAVFDYNNDGLLDIFFTNGAAIPSL